MIKKFSYFYLYVSFLHDKVHDKTAHLQYVSTADQRADILTKVIDGALFYKHLAHLVMDIISYLSEGFEGRISFCHIFTWHLSIYNYLLESQL